MPFRPFLSILAIPLFVSSTSCKKTPAVGIYDPNYTSLLGESLDSWCNPIPAGGPEGGNFSQNSPWKIWIIYSVN